jgi:hypothetical protein
MNSKKKSPAKKGRQGSWPGKLNGNIEQSGMYVETIMYADEGTGR